MTTPRLYHVHDWHSKKYVEEWAKRQDRAEAERKEQFQTVADILPFDKTAPFSFLDIGAGYGALTQFLLKKFPKAKAVCQDGSEQMAKLGAARMAKMKSRVNYALSDLSKPGWSKVLHGPFDAVVSSIAIHNVGDSNIIKAIYKETAPLVKPGGCFINADLIFPSSDTLGNVYNLVSSRQSDEDSRSAGILGLIKNIRGSGVRKPGKSEPQLTNLERQLQWLRDAGFQEVDCFWKNGIQTVFGGFK